MIAIDWDRVRRAQQLMVQQGLSGLMVMNHDGFRYFLGDDYAQPRAIILATGEPIFTKISATILDFGAPLFTQFDEPPPLERTRCPTLDERAHRGSL